MTKTTLTLSPQTVRRLAITKQHLAGKRPPADANGILEIVRDLGCLQIDPINVVARPQYLIPFSRLGVYDPRLLDQLLWRDRKLFEYWAHCASIVLTEDYPIHHLTMRTYARGNSAWDKRVRQWIADNAELRRAILSIIRRRGPTLSRDLLEAGVEPKTWVSTGWTSGRNASRMLDFLWMQGKLMVVGREGLQKKWDLAERFLPAWTPRTKWNEQHVVEHAAQRALRALGVATPRQINLHFIRGRYPNLECVLAKLEKEQRIARVQIVDDGQVWKGDWYIHTDDLPRIEKLNSDWQPRTTVLSPFDNLICDRARTKLLFNFDYSIEIYTPQTKRKFGYYVLPILHGDQLIGRMDAVMDRARGTLIVNALYAEPHSPNGTSTQSAIADAIEDLSKFLGAHQIEHRKNAPREWRHVLR
jgi:uncharacterized protein YcaQ